MSARRSKLAARLQYLLVLYVFVQVVVGSFTELPYPYWAGWLPIVAILVIAFVRRRSADRETAAHPQDPVPIDPPVTGRWSALNSPATKVPSHGTHAYGQTYAIDIVADPEDRERPGFAWVWPVARSNADFPAFGAPLLAVADATVVHAEDGQRDHLSRNSLLALLYLVIVESIGRTLGGARRVVGNHVVLDLGDGTYALYAHLERGSLAVRTGDKVTTGQELARCGNSGNSTEPHVHFQLMDTPDLTTARGLPFTWRGVGVPVNGERFTVQDERELT
ncbi:M23 family metallopeptidase [Streptomyces sp. YC504]|uniref:M23 family metallopeptidase n=1 Tax=Streptomyces mesophilus TaxID=1775132 RepID=A0A6G4XGY3_9ACTN|nr:M23 family metallopeptidase [Streptomyces mesophilus]NGO76110.1 M23 family metallopeptidase [Streptomyces mesophilus]